MFSPKSDIYRSEWLELVFANRNKGYGAYEMRQSYNHTLIKALLISCSLVLFTLSGLKFLGRTHADIDKNPLTGMTDPLVIKLYNGSKIPPGEVKKTFRNTAKANKTKINTPTKRFVNMIPVSSSHTEQPPSIDDLKNAAVGTENVKGTNAGSDLPGSTGVGTEGGGTEQGTSTEAGEEAFLTTVEKLPMFPGGIEAFSKFLSKNLQYPGKASDENISGKVLVSFIVEKNGALTDFQIVRGVGFGCDEEAIRVLKKAPHWIPGEQNGKKVRVKYTIPIVFQMSED